jgi:DNA polymerase-3 subunit gamma/tau
MSQALYRKWRPARFEEVVGQEHITRTLQNSVAAGRIGHAYLLCGPRGTGKTTTARLIAKAVNCLQEERSRRPCNVCSTCVAVNDGRFLDLIEIDAASNTGVDDIRDLRDKINFAPSQGRLKVYIIDEVHMLSTAAFNALLKTLEEPPPHAMFVLATTEEHKVPLTVKSRCQQFNFRLLTDAEIVGRLRWLAERESLQIEPGALMLIARQGAGSLRDAESLLDQLITAPEDIITLSRAQMVLGTATDSSVSALAGAWLDGDGATGLHIIHEALASGTDARQFCRQMVTYLRQLLLLQAAGTDLAFELPEERNLEMMAQAKQAPRQSVIRAIKLFSEAALTPSSGWQPQLPLEIAFFEMLPEGPAPVAPGPVMAGPEVADAPSQAAADSMGSPQVEPAPFVPAVPATSPDVDQASEASAPKAGQFKTVPQDQTLSLRLVQSHWPEFLIQIGQENKNLPALLNMGKPLAIEGSTLILGFDYPIFKEKFDNTMGAAHLVAEALSDLLGIKCTARSVVTSDYPILISKDDFQALARELGGVVNEE